MILKALAKKPEDRFPSIQVFAEALEEASKAPSPSKAPPIGTQLLIYSGHSDRVYTLAWPPDGSCIASGSLDKTVQVWQAE